MPELISIQGLDEAEVLAALVNAAAPVGLGFFAAASRQHPFTVEEARVVLSETRWPDYIAGRPIKTRFSDDGIDVRLYDRDHGEGAGAKVIAALRLQAESHV